MVNNDIFIQKTSSYNTRDYKFKKNQKNINRIMESYTRPISPESEDKVSDENNSQNEIASPPPSEY